MSSEAKKWIKDTFASQYALADKLGWQRSKVSKLLTGRQKWSEDDIFQVAELTGISPVAISRILRGKEMAADVYNYNSIQSWGPNPNDRSPDPNTWIAKEVWRVPRIFMEKMGFTEEFNENDYKIWSVIGRANSPRYNEHDFLVVNTAIKSITGTSDYLVDMGGYADSRSIEPFTDNDGMASWNLSSYNPDFADRTVRRNAYKILGAIVGQIKPV